MSLIDLYKRFHCLAIQQEFQPSARVLFDTFLYQMNAALYPDSLVFSERDLIKITGLKKTTLHAAKHFLTSRHIIKCKPFKNRTAISFDGEFADLVQETTNRPVSDHSATSSRPLEAHSYQRTREDLKTKDKDKITTDSAGAELSELDEVLEYWERDLRGGRLTFEHQSELSVWLEQKGIAWLKDAMKIAADSNNNPRGISFKYLKAVVANRLKPKGGETNDTYNYALPDTSNDPDWEKYL